VSERAPQHTDVTVGDVHDSQLVIGDHTTVQTVAGTKVTVINTGERPTPRLRPLPVIRLPRATELFGREDELALIADAGPGTPVQLTGPDGAGKTSMLKLGAAGATPPAEGVVFDSARHRSLDEVQVGLYGAFWECTPPFTPAPSEFGEFLEGREALLVLDDCELDRDDLATLLERLPRCAFVLASATRTLWSQGTARALADLDRDAAVALLERELGRALSPDEREAARIVVARIGGSPQLLVETAALIEDGRGSLRELADAPGALERRLDPSALTGPQLRVLEVLAAIDGAALGVEHVGAVAGVADAGGALRQLERRGWVKSGSPRYRGIRPLPRDTAGLPPDEVARTLLPHLAAWAAKSVPGAVAEEAEGIEGALRLGADVKRWSEVLALSLAAERALFASSAWSSCCRVLRTGAGAAEALGDESARAYLLHQLGSQSLCLGERGEAEARLTEALRIREGLGEREAAALTRHNLEQMWGGGSGGSDGGGHGGGGGGFPRVPIALGVLAAIAIVAGAIALAGGGDDAAKNVVPASSPSQEAKANGSAAANAGSATPADTVYGGSDVGSTPSETGSTTSPDSSTDEGKGD
jgi:hypothetical protein